MTIRKLNYTGRKKILHSDVSIVIEPNDSRYYDIRAEMRLDSYGFAEDAAILIEAYHQTRYERYDAGHVGAPRLPFESTLTQFVDGDPVLFRVKVVGTGQSAGLLLGEAKELRPELHGGAGSRIPLLPAKAVDLGNRPWHLNLDDAPVLEVNSRFGSQWAELPTSWEFSILAYPAILQRVLERIVLENETTPNDDMTDWEQLWLRFGQDLPGSSPFPDSLHDGVEAKEEWIESVVEAFCYREQTFKNCQTFLEGEA